MADTSAVRDKNGRACLGAAMIYGFLAFVVGGCAPPVDVSNLESIDGYEQWYRVDVSGPVPGHGDSHRIIYANDDARAYLHEGAYRTGSVIVKEILEGDDAESALSYIAVMRKVNPNDVPEGATVEGGWLFTMLDAPGAEETQSFVCWENCHVQAPIDGAWLDYGM